MTLASTFAGVGPIDQVRRWSESAKENIMIDHTDSTGVYNNNMGGVGKIDYLKLESGLSICFSIS